MGCSWCGCNDDHDHRPGCWMLRRAREERDEADRRRLTLEERGVLALERIATALERRKEPTHG